MFDYGDIISVQYPSFTHYGIYTGDNQVIHNSKKLGRVWETTFDEFSDNHRVILSPIKPDDPRLAVERAKRYLGQPYRLFSNNCEHFVRTVSGLVKESPQIQKYSTLALGGSAFLMADNPMVKGAGAGAAIGALLSSSEKSPIGSSLLGALAGGFLGLVARSAR
uniref:Lecithin retinol acyltransferase n=1 Tax=Candidatus Kentrum sp. MB TaxID=2138164 RepID=A0A450XLY7_9GAMM|nr:MAG: Lecithin retinol acyltransferase [Candidatus Kentron sp. MB]VFK30287.1 MAG: Lecithin retinol acyltransferase [Candidatus Kentron sp. MB]VFK74290.1 MAG: Lecithin retinol acyltransferase [Candidatus Kentron sp. MB]